MSSVYRVADRYAKALADEAIDKKVIDTIYDEANMIRQTIKDSNELRLFLLSPVVRPDKKKDILVTLFKGKVSDLMLDFLILLCKKSRENILREIYHEFINRYHDYKGIARVKVTSAIELPESTLATIKTKLKSSLNKEILLELFVNPALIGGLVIQHKDVQLDMSVKNSLNRIKNNFAV